MNLFEVNTRLAVKLNQSFETLYNMDYNEYSLILNIVNKDTEEANNTISTDFIPDAPKGPVKVNLPDHLKFK
jgi:hypothetical protein